MISLKVRQTTYKDPQEYFLELVRFYYGVHLYTIMKQNVNNIKPIIYKQRYAPNDVNNTTYLTNLSSMFQENNILNFPREPGSRHTHEYNKRSSNIHVAIAIIY